MIVENDKIDYLGVLNYLQNNGGMPYSNPEKPGINAQEKKQFQELKNQGRQAVNEMVKMAKLCAKLFDLNKCEPIVWLDSSNVKTRKYLWAQLKYQEYSKCPESISIFVEKSEVTNKARLRFSLGLKLDKADKLILDNYHTYLDLPVKPNSNLVYTAGNNGIDIIDDDRKTIKQKLVSGIYKKVEISRILEWDDHLTNNEIEQEMIKSIHSLIPYYDHVLKIDYQSIFNEADIDYEMEIKQINYPKNMILYGPPGTGKTYNSIIYAVGICDNQKNDELKDYDAVIKRYNELKQQGRIVFTTFHQSYGYEEFIEGIRPVIKEDDSSLGYQIVAGIFKQFCKAANKDDKPYVLIIDEINRGNISKIFGELITLIEESKRQGSKEEISLLLPYSNEEFSIPGNVYLLGTMNTADRSIALMDTALRRRFQFIEMMPDEQVLNDLGINKIVVNEKELDVVKMLKTINQRIEYLFDREHTIGHAFFTKLKDNLTLECLADIFKNSLIPLLQEYFYEDYQKIMLVLGDNDKSKGEYQFINDEPVSNSLFKGDLSDIDLSDRIYRINEAAFYQIESYLEIMK